MRAWGNARGWGKTKSAIEWLQSLTRPRPRGTRRRSRMIHGGRPRNELRTFARIHQRTPKDPTP